VKVGKSPPLPGQEYHLAFGVPELPLRGRRRCFRGYLTRLDLTFRIWLLASSAAGRGARRGTTNICRPCGKIQTLLKDSLQVATEGDLRLQAEAAGRDTGSRLIAPTYSEMTFTAPPRVSCHAAAQLGGGPEDEVAPSPGVKVHDSFKSISSLPPPPGCG